MQKNIMALSTKFLLTFLLSVYFNSDLIRAYSSQNFVSNSTREGKFILTFDDARCKVNEEIGACQSKKNCRKHGGKSLGSCAYGYGTCCQYTAQCGNQDSVTVKRNQTLLITPTLANLPKTCTFVFPRQSGVCQLRLDYEMFDIAQPEAISRDCNTDYLSIRGSTTVNSLKICGRLEKREHMHLDYGNGNEIQIRIRTRNNMPTTVYGYKIGVTQIKCNSELRAPSDCLQYFRESIGTVRSFNYPLAQLNDQYYKVCVRKTESLYELQWKPCPPETNPMVPASSTFCFIGGDCNLDFGVPENTPCVADFLNFPSFGRICRPRFPGFPSSPNTETLIEKGFSFYVHFDDKEPTMAPKTIKEDSSLCDSLTGCSPTGKFCNLTALGPPPKDHKPWKLSENGEYCESEPKYTILDRNNTGFCLAYSEIEAI